MVENAPSWGNKIYGRDILKELREQFQHFGKQLLEKELKVAIVQFASSKQLDERLLIQVEAAKKSTQVKLKTFELLSIKAISYELSWETSREKFESLLTQWGRDERMAGIIVQYPMPRQCEECLPFIPTNKDLDCLRRHSDRFPGPATSEAITRVVEPFAKDNPLVAVVGAIGFVGRGVVNILEQKGIRVMALDARDPGFQPKDLLRVREADIVVSTTGQREILDERHLLPHHRLVVDCGFSPIGGEIYGDVKKSAYSIPQYITPVPGGTGPMEMAILAERLVQKELEIKLEPWRLGEKRYHTRKQIEVFLQEYAKEREGARKQIEVLQEEYAKEREGDRVIPLKTIVIEPSLKVEIRENVPGSGICELTVSHHGREKRYFLKLPEKHRAEDMLITRKFIDWLQKFEPDRLISIKVYQRGQEQTPDIER